jgi:acetyl esterase/lipase
MGMVPTVAAQRFVDHGSPQELDLYLPRTAGPHPLVMWVHGGGWVGGSRADRVPLFLVDAGFAVASIDYRLSGVAPFPAAIQDCRAAIRWLRRHGPGHGIDPSRIGAIGESAGGHLVSLLGLADRHPTWDDAGEQGSCAVQAVVDVCGVSDVAALASFWATKDTGLVDMLSRFVGGPVAERREQMRDASPMHHVSVGAPPFLMIHATLDDVVPIDHSRSLAAALTAVGGEAVVHEVPLAIHAGLPEMPETPCQELVTGFFRRHLGRPVPDRR